MDMCLSLGILLLASLVTDPPQFKRYDTSTGLSNNIIHDVFQDSEGYLWIATENGLNRFDGHEFEYFYHTSEDSSSLSHDIVKSVFEDSNGNLWVGTWSGLNKFDRQKKTFMRFEAVPGYPDYRFEPVSVFIDKKENFWFPFAEGLIRFNPEDEQVMVFLSGIDLPESTFQFLIQNESKEVWIFSPSTNSFSGFNYEMKQFETYSLPNASYFSYSTETFRAFLNKPLPEQIPFNPGFILPDLPSEKEPQQALQDYNSDIWIGTDSGLFVYKSGDASEEITISENGGGLSRFVQQLFMDRWGGIWAGTRNGLYHYDPNVPMFNHERIDGKNQVIMSMEETYSYFWYGTLGNGFFRKNKKTGAIRNFQLYDPGSNEVWDIVADPEDDSQLWIATTSGLKVRDSKTGLFEHIPLPLSQNSQPIIFSIVPSPDNQFWIVGAKDLWLIDSSSKQVLNRISLSGFEGISTLQDVIPLEDQTILVATQGAGIIRIDLEDSTQIPLYDGAENQMFKNFPVWDLHQSEDGTIWTASSQGLISFHPDSGNLSFYKSDASEKPRIFYSIIEDGTGNLWLGTDKEIALFDKKKDSFRYFDQNHGIQNPEFNRRAALTLSNGQFLFGGTTGITTFDPLQASLPLPEPLIVIKSAEVFFEDFSKTLKQDITLGWNENNLNFRFSAITFTLPELIEYRYQLENHDPVWISSGRTGSARYSSLPPGSYTFIVEAEYGNRVWVNSEAAFSFTIAPPFWKTGWAYTFYFIFGIGLVVLAIRFRTRSLKEKSEKLEHLISERTIELKEQKDLAVEAKRKLEIQAEQLTELDEMKSQFFANISHELRTPLTLIDAPLQQLLAEDIDALPTENLEKKLKVIRKNSKHLSHLIDELLDLSRLRQKTIEAKPVTVNIRTWFSLFVDSYQSLAFSKGISFRTRQETGSYKLLLLDVQKFEKIATNLVNNALKFTTKDGFIEVAISIEKGRLVFSVSDSGIGIPEKDLPHVFERFFKSSQPEVNNSGGLGIGLSLSKELAMVMKGELTAKSEAGTGSTFTLRIPIDETVPEEEIPKDSASTSHRTFSNTVLIVEDNTEMREFLIQLLESDFEIFEARNGKEALSQLKVISPNLILSDLMMPEMDGQELTQHLRSIPNYAHIPILMLTARASDEDRLTSLRMGVDDYLAKPFIPDEVRVRALNLAENHKKRIAYSQEELEDGTPPQEKELLEIQQIVEEHLSDSTLNVNTLAGYLHTSERQIYRKVQQLTGMTPIEYINSVRLAKARYLLISQKRLTIDLVAEQVGFKSRSYFSKLFKNAYGLSPGKFQKEK